MEFSSVLQNRRSVKKYDPDHVITDDALRSLFEKVILSPSSFNLQHWRFVVVRGKALKAKIRKAAYDQEQIESASAVIVVSGKLNAHENADQIYAEAPENVRQSMIPMIGNLYTGKDDFQRDETIRSASLAAMTLMLAAYDMGYATGPMIGFDPLKVGELIKLKDNHIPVMIIVIGKQQGEMRPRAFRYSLEEVVKLESFEGAGLA